MLILSSRNKQTNSQQYINFGESVTFIPCLVNFGQFLLYSDRSLGLFWRHWLAYFWICWKIEHELLSISGNGCTWFVELSKSSFLCVQNDAFPLIEWNSIVFEILRLLFYVFLFKPSNVFMCISFRTYHGMGKNYIFIQFKQINYKLCWSLSHILVPRMCVCVCVRVDSSSKLSQHGKLIWRLFGNWDIFVYSLLNHTKFCHFICQFDSFNTK